MTGLMIPIASELPPATAAELLRSRLLAALLTDEETALVQDDETAARVLTRDGRYLALVDAEPAELAGRIAALRKAQPPGVLSVIVVGEIDRETERTIRRATPSWQVTRQIGFDSVDLSGRVRHLSGPKARELGPALAALPTVQPLAPEVLAERLAAGAQVAGREERFAAALRAGFPWVTTTLALVCCALVVAAQSWQSGNVTGLLIHMGANSGARVAAGEPWRILSSAFLHLGFEHLIANLTALIVFGIVLERLLGARRYLLLYGLSALGGGVASALFGSSISVGASGAIWGLMTAGVALALRPRGLFPPRALRRMFKLAVWPVVINFFYSFSPGIDLYAHFGGGLVGFALMLSGALTIGVQPTWDGAPRAPERRRPVLTLAAATLAIAMLASVALALATGRPWALGDPPRLRPVVVGDSGVSLSLPEAIALPPKIETRPNGVRLFDFITIGEPLGVEVVIAPIGPGGDPAATLEAERQTLDRVSPPKATREGAATLVTVGARRFAFVRYRMRGATMQTWVTVLNDQEVVLRVYQYGAVPPSWSGAAGQIVASLR